MQTDRTLSINCGSSCSICRRFKKLDFSSNQYKVKLEQRVEANKWRYDCLILKREDCAPVCALEVVVTHWSTDEKIEGTLQLGIAIVEVFADDILQHSIEKREMHLQSQNNHHLASKFCDDCCMQAPLLDELQQLKRLEGKPQSGGSFDDQLCGSKSSRAESSRAEKSRAEKRNIRG